MMKKLLSIAVLAMMGGAAMAQTEVIYQTDFSNAEDNAQWTIINANNDQSAAGAERTWSIADGELKCDNFATSNDDYAFTPALNCAKGTLKLTYKAKGYSGRYSDSYEVVLTSTPQSITSPRQAPTTSVSMTTRPIPGQCISTMSRLRWKRLPLASATSRPSA